MKEQAMQSFLANKKEDLKRICQLLKVKRLYVFGSALSGEFSDDSDIDFLISFSENLTHEEYADIFLALHYRLRELFDREIDIVTERTLSNPYFIKSIDESKELIYEA